MPRRPWVLHPAGFEIPLLHQLTSFSRVGRESDGTAARIHHHAHGTAGHCESLAAARPEARVYVEARLERELAALAQRQRDDLERSVRDFAVELRQDIQLFSDRNRSAEEESICQVWIFALFC